MTKQTKWPTHVVAATWRPHRVARRVTAWQQRADWLPGARHHNMTAWRAKYGTDADVSTTTLAALSQGLWSGEGGAFHSARLLTSHTTHTTPPTPHHPHHTTAAGRGGAALLKYKYIHVYIYMEGGREGGERTHTNTRTHMNTHEHTQTHTNTHKHTRTHENT